MSVFTAADGGFFDVLFDLDMGLVLRRDGDSAAQQREGTERALLAIPRVILALGVLRDALAQEPVAPAPDEEWRRRWRVEQVCHTGLV